MPGLATRLRGNLKRLLHEHGKKQTLLAKHMGVGNSRISEMLKTDEHLESFISVGRLQQLADFFQVPVATLLADPDQPEIPVSKLEAQLVGMFRRLPTAQQSTLYGWLDYIFGQHDAVERQRRENAMIRQSLTRQIERQAPVKPRHR